MMSEVTQVVTIRTRKNLVLFSMRLYTFFYMLCILIYYLKLPLRNSLNSVMNILVLILLSTYLFTMLLFLNSDIFNSGIIYI